MRVDLINNSGRKNFVEELEEQMRLSRNFEIATAFITKEAIELIEIFLKQNKNSDRIGRLITGFYHCFNSKEVLQQLQKMAAKSKGRFQVQMSKNLRFHWKYYKFENTNKVISFIGSANFTGSGMNDKGELLTKLLLRKTDRNDKQVIENLSIVFNKEWESSTDILIIPLGKYKQTKHNLNAVETLDPSIRYVLLKDKPIKLKLNQDLSARVIFFNNKYLSDKSMRLISKYKSTWDKDRFEYFCYSIKSDYEAALKANVLFMIEKGNREYRFTIADIEDKYVLQTPDGKYFIAYKPRRKSKTETEDIRGKLKKIGLDYHSRKFSSKTLGTRQTKEVIELFIN